MWQLSNSTFIGLSVSKPGIEISDFIISGSKEAPFSIETFTQGPSQVRDVTLTPDFTSFLIHFSTRATRSKKKK